MSIFKVQLTNVQQGLLDSVGQSTGVSIQRTAYIMGPHKVNRKLTDGETFTDVNYYKQFCYPQASLDQAILALVSDDGSPWTDIPLENVSPYSTKLTLTAGYTFTGAGMSLDILSLLGGYATFTQITPTVNCKMRINGNVNAVMTLLANSTQIFNPGDMTIGMLEFDNSASGASTGSVSITVSVTVNPQS